MCTAELSSNQILLFSHIITYGGGANASITEQIRDEIESMWNEPMVYLGVEGESRRVRFKITASFQPNLQPEEVLRNTDPRNNFIRIEDYASGNISYVDGLGCNSGYFKTENLYVGSTTAAHEYGHTLGLDHPADTDLRGKGTPGIMYPRGTLVDPQFQYNPDGRAGDSSNGGTMHPKYRKVQPGDILNLRLQRLRYRKGVAILGAFTNRWHEAHG